MSNRRTSDDDLDRIFKALANRVRRSICDELKLRPLTTGQLVECFPEIDRTTVMMHLRVLEQAGLVVPVRKGRERFNHLDAIPIQELHRRWIAPHAERAAERLLRLKDGLENEAQISKQK